MKFASILIIFVIFIVLINNVYALAIYVKPKTSSGNLQPSTTFSYTFNFTTNYDCTGVVAAFDVPSLTTGTDGIGYVNLDISSIIGVPKYLCEYRGGSLRAIHNITDMFLKNLFLQNINATGDITANRFCTGNTCGNVSQFLEKSNETAAILALNDSNYKAFIQWANETGLNVNSSTFWQEMSGILDWFVNNNGKLDLNTSKLNSNILNVSSVFNETTWVIDQGYGGRIVLEGHYMNGSFANGTDGSIGRSLNTTLNMTLLFLDSLLLMENIDYNYSDTYVTFNIPLYDNQHIVAWQELSTTPFGSTTYDGADCDGSDGEINRKLEVGTNVIMVYVDGLQYFSGEDFTIGGSAITFSTNIYDTQKIVVWSRL